MEMRSRYGHQAIGGDDARLYFRHSDHLGSTSVLSDADGLRVEGSEVVYAPFGEIRIGEQSELTDFGFTGQRLDESTGGLMYYGARYYLPGLRRFISADTIVPGAGNPQALNRYSYVANNPIRFIDPTGHVYTGTPMIDGQYTPESHHNMRNRETTARILASSSALAGSEAGYNTNTGHVSPPGASSSDGTPTSSPGNGDRDGIPGGDGGGGGGAGFDITPELLWSSADMLWLFPPEVAWGFGEGARYAQHASTFFSAVGALIETGFLIAALATWQPELAVVGFGIHATTTNELENICSATSFGLSLASEAFSGQTRVDVYDTHASLVVGQDTFVAGAGSALSSLSPEGYADTFIDLVLELYGSYSAENPDAPGLYDWLGMRGDFVPLDFGDEYQLRIQFGD